MSEVLLSNHALSSKEFEAQCGMDIGQISSLGCISPVVVSPNTPYVAANDDKINRNILAQLSAVPQDNHLADIALCYGEEQVVALAETTSKLSDFGTSFIGAASSVYVNRASGFTHAVSHYQSALIKYQRNLQEVTDPKMVSKLEVKFAFEEMQRQFQHELNLFLLQNKARKNNPVVDMHRATEFVRNSRNIAKLNIVDQVQASNVVKFSQYAKFLGDGLTVLDFGQRIGNIHNSYRANGNWERELFIESAEFVVNAGTGIVAVRAGSAILRFLMIATPMGWVGLIAGGVAVAGFAAFSSMSASSIFQKNAGDIYDGIMQKIGSQ